MAAHRHFSLAFMVCLVLAFTEGGILSTIYGKPKKDKAIAATSSDNATDCNYTGPASDGHYTLPTGSNGKYINNQLCHIVLQTEPGSHIIVVNFTHFDTENGYSCRYDHLDVKLGGTTVDSLCGTLGSFVKRYDTAEGELTMTFSSDGSVTKTGFSFITYLVPDCDFNSRELQGRYVLPTLPNGNYATDLTCNITLESVDHPHITTVNFMYFNVEPQFSCLYDYLEVKTGNTSEDHLCGNLGSFVKQYQTNEPVLRMTFESDSSVTLKGFAFTYKTETDCNYTSKDLSGSYTLPTGSNGKYVNNQLCHIALQTELQRHVVEINFTYFETESYGCRYDYLEVKDGNTTEDILCGSLGSFVKRYDIDEPELTMIFHSDSSYTKRGFAFDYTTYEVPDCDYNSKELEGHYALPTLADGSYATDLNCNIVLESVAEPHITTVNFTYFNVEPQFSCLYDYLEVKTGNTTVDKLCGNLGSFIKQYETRGSVLTMTFVSDFSVTSEGFSFVYKTETETAGEQWTVSSGQLLPDLTVNKAME